MRQPLLNGRIERRLVHRIGRGALRVTVYPLRVNPARITALDVIELVAPSLCFGVIAPGSVRIVLARRAEPSIRGQYLIHGGGPSGRASGRVLAAQLVPNLLLGQRAAASTTAATQPEAIHQRVQTGVAGLQIRLEVRGVLLVLLAGDLVGFVRRGRLRLGALAGGIRGHPASDRADGGRSHYCCCDHVSLPDTCCRSSRRAQSPAARTTD
ncbi:hypothetical protein D3C71_1524560 [compost metagenome]